VEADEMGRLQIEAIFSCGSHIGGDDACI